MWPRFCFLMQVNCFVNSATEKANTLIEALAWIRRFRDKTTVIKVGGSVLGDTEALQHLLLDIHFMETVGMRPVIVHGGGSRISAAMETAGIEPNFVQGRRYTDAASLEIVEKVLAEETNAELAATYEKVGGRAMTLNFQSTPVLTGELLKLQDDDGKPVDLGFVGTITKVDRLVIDNLCYAGQVPFIPSMCETETGQKLNVNADSVAQAEQLIGEGVISGGMIPKIEACIETVKRGVSKVHIVDGRLRHGLLMEIYTSSGIGTVITAD